MTAKAVNLADKLSTFAEYWSLKIVSQFNGHDVMVVKVQGDSFGTPMATPMTFSLFWTAL